MADDYPLQAPYEVLNMRTTSTPSSLWNPYIMHHDLSDALVIAAWGRAKRFGVNENINQERAIYPPLGPCGVDLSRNLYRNGF